MIKKQVEPTKKRERALTRYLKSLGERTEATGEGRGP